MHIDQYNSACGAVCYYINEKNYLQIRDLDKVMI